MSLTHPSTILAYLETLIGFELLLCITGSYNEIVVDVGIKNIRPVVVHESRGPHPE